jgi:predicted nucleotidyltransferase
MNKDEKNRAIIEAVADAVKAFPNVSEAVLFGSRALGREKEGSDVDIALKGDVDLDTLSAVAHALNEETALPYFFDVLVYDSIANKALKAHIDRYGVIIER